jgi:hypothetical protein
LRGLKEPLARAWGSSIECTGDMLYKTDRRHGLRRSATATLPTHGATHDDVVCLGKRVESWINVWQFLSSYQKEEMSVADLCRAYGISRPAAARIPVRTRRLSRWRTLFSRFAPSNPLGAHANWRQGWKCYSRTSCGLRLAHIRHHLKPRGFDQSSERLNAEEVRFRAARRVV